MSHEKNTGIIIRVENHEPFFGPHEQKVTILNCHLLRCLRHLNRNLRWKKVASEKEGNLHMSYDQHTLLEPIAHVFLLKIVFIIFQVFKKKTIIRS
jgi:hypothetical protein